MESLKQKLVKIFEINKEKLQNVGVEEIWWDVDAPEMTRLIIKTNHDEKEIIETKLGKTKYIRLPKDAEELVTEIMKPMEQELFNERRSILCSSYYYYKNDSYQKLIYPVKTIIELCVQKYMENEVLKIKHNEH